MLYHAKHEDHWAEYNNIGNYKDNIECPCVLPVEVTPNHTAHYDEDSPERDNGFGLKVCQEPAEQVRVDHDEDGSSHW